MTTDWRDAGQDGGTYGSTAAAEGWRRIAAARAQSAEPMGEPFKVRVADCTQQRATHTSGSWCGVMGMPLRARSAALLRAGEAASDARQGAGCDVRLVLLREELRHQLAATPHPRLVEDR